MMSLTNKQTEQKIRIMAGLLLFISIFAITASIVKAQDATPTPVISDDQVNAIAKNMFCPVCENTPLDVCATQACAEWRELIRLKLAQGWTENQIREYFVEQYGDRVLATPPARGFNWLVYILPPLAFIAGIYMLYKAYKAYFKPVDEVISSPNETQTKEDDEYTKRIEDELKKL
jgi:cytochrome c-type biogenesis protein CcmH